MRPDRRLCIVVADGEHARFVQRDRDGTLRTGRSIDSATAHQRSHELVSDRPGASFTSTSSARHAETPKHDPHELAKQDFCRFIAAEIGTLADANEFDDVVLVAPAHRLNDIEAALAPPVVAMVVGRLAKDLVKTPDGELWTHLTEWVAAPERAG